MAVRYSTWPDLLDCGRCGETFTPPSREECFDGFPPSGRCRPCDELLERVAEHADFYAALHQARYARAAQRAAGFHSSGKNQSRPAQGVTAMSTPIDRPTLEAILEELSPHTAGELLDVLAKLGLLPPCPSNPDARIPFTCRDEPPTVAAAANRQLWLVAS